MLAESALCLAFDEPTEYSGVVTASTGMGEALLHRLEETKLFTWKPIALPAKI